MNKIQVSDFSLKDTIESGQIFYFEKINDFYYIVDYDKIFKIKQEGNKLFFDNISENDLIYYFSLDLDLNSIKHVDDDEYILLALEKYWGLRLIRQNLFQCLIGFVCSSNSNIPKIKKTLS